MARKYENEAVTEYWLEHYGSEGSTLCSLCGNSGVIDTRETAVSAAGVNSGRLNFCICPNGQVKRHIAAQSGRKVPEDPGRTLFRVIGRKLVPFRVPRKTGDK